MKALLHKILYRTLPLEGYLRAVSRLFFISYRLGLGRRSAATEYVYHLPRLAKAGDTAIDIGANLGYYARPLSEIVGTAGRVHAVEPVPVVCRVLRRNLRGCRNVEIFDCALGAENKEITMSNDAKRVISARDETSWAMPPERAPSLSPPGCGAAASFSPGWSGSISSSATSKGMS